jgi:hypothetical protein
VDGKGDTRMEEWNWITIGWRKKDGSMEVWNTRGSKEHIGVERKKFTKRGA